MSARSFAQAGMSGSSNARTAQSKLLWATKLAMASVITLLSLLGMVAALSVVVIPDVMVYPLLRHLDWISRELLPPGSETHPPLKALVIRPAFFGLALLFRAIGSYFMEWVFKQIDDNILETPQSRSETNPVQHRGQDQQSGERLRVINRTDERIAPSETRLDAQSDAYRETIENLQGIVANSIEEKEELEATIEDIASILSVPGVQKAVLRSLRPDKAASEKERTAFSELSQKAEHIFADLAG